MLVLALHGELDLAMALRIEADLLLALYALHGTSAAVSALPVRASRGKTMVLDLRHVTFMDCSGLDLICRLRDQLAERNGRLVLMNLRPIVIRVLKLAALHEPFELIGQLDDLLPSA